MYAVLHLGEFDGAEFDMRPWNRVPNAVFARRGGTGKLGLVLSQTPKLGSRRYQLVSGEDQEFHYTADDSGAGSGQWVHEDQREPVAA